MRREVNPARRGRLGSKFAKFYLFFVAGGEPPEDEFTTTTCPHCGVTVPEDDLVCPRCGKNLVGESVPPPPEEKKKTPGFGKAFSEKYRARLETQKPPRESVVRDDDLDGIFLCPKCAVKS